jgi:hypothetical protein
LSKTYETTFLLKKLLLIVSGTIDHWDISDFDSKIMRFTGVISLYDWQQDPPSILCHIYCKKMAFHRCGFSCVPSSYNFG